MPDQPIDLDNEHLQHLIDDPDWDCSERNDAWEYLSSLAAELRRLRETEAKLEKDAHGRPVVPRAEYWTYADDYPEAEAVRVVAVECGRVRVRSADGCVWMQFPARLFDTRSAAAAALAGREGK